MPSNAPGGTTPIVGGTGAEILVPRAAGTGDGQTLREPLVVGYAAPGGFYTYVPYLGHHVEVRWPVNGEPTAVLRVRLAREGWGVDLTPPYSGLPEQIRPLRLELHDGKLIRIETGNADPAQNLRVFDGFVERVAFGASAAADRHERWATLACVSVVDVLRRHPDYHIYGQCQVSKAQREAGEPAEALRPVRYDGLPAIFNPGGRGNCWGTRPVLPYTQPQQATYDDWIMPVFCDEGDRQAQAWTYARVLLYLLALPRLTPQGELGAWTDFGFFDAPIVDADLNAGGPATIVELIRRRDLHTVDGDDVGPQLDPWNRALLAKPVDLVIHHLSWLDALKVVCLRAGLWYRWDPLLAADGEHRMALRFGLPEGARRRSLLLPSSAFQTGDKPWSAVRAVSNIEAVDLTIDYGACLNVAEGRGAAGAAEVTIELVPGWRPNADWDVSAEGAAAALAFTASETWTQRYNWTGGAARPGSEYSLVGRLWGLNTIGAWDASTHARPNGPFGAARYALFDLADVGLGGGPDGLERGRHALRRRVAGPCLSGMTPDTPWPPIVEISVDGGATWTLLAGEARVSTRDLRVLITADDLRSIRPGGPSSPSYVEAYIRGLARVRVTATIPTDQDLATGRVQLAVHSASSRTRFALQSSAAWRYRDRDAEGNSQFRGGALPQLLEHDDLTALAEIERFLQAVDRVPVRGLARVPWLAWPVWTAEHLPLPTAGFLPGDVIDGIQSEDAAGAESPWNWPLPATADPARPAYTAIAAVTWVVDMDAPAEMTLLELGDGQTDARPTGDTHA